MTNLMHTCLTLQYVHYNPLHVLLTVHLSIILDNDRLVEDCSKRILQYVYYNPLHVSSIICSSSGGWIVEDYSKRILQYVYYNPLHVSSIICSSSGGWIVLMQHLVSSLSVSGRPVHRTATYWDWRHQMLHQYNSTSWWWAYNARNM